jgi:hypothetical protein
MVVTEGLNYHLKNNIPLMDSIFRYGSKAHFNLINEVRELYLENQIELSIDDKILTETDLGKFDLYEGQEVPLDLPMVEAEYKGKEVSLNKPKRGGSKAYYVYVRDPKTKRIKKVSFGSGGLRAKIRNPKARKAFAARHKCSTKKDRTKAGYWSCNLPRYASMLGLGSNMNTFW